MRLTLAFSVFAALVACAVAGDDAVPSPAVSTFAKQHSGASAGVVAAATGKELGKEAKIGGLDAYVAVPSKAPTAAVVLFTDIFGYKTEGIRKWADKLAAEGFLVVVPDYFKGNPRKKTDTPESLAAWRALYPREQVLKESAAVFADIRKIYPSVKKIGVKGFCWGGLYAVLLASGSPTPAAASVAYHTALVTKAEIEGINSPIMFQQSDPKLDKQINETFYKEIQGILSAKAAKGLDASITNYPGQPHGFSLRGDSSDVATANAANTAFTAGTAFLKKHLLT